MAHTHKAKISVCESYPVLTHTDLFKAERTGPDWADTHDQAGSTPSVNSFRLFCISANCTGWGGKPPNNTVMAALVTPTCKSPAVTGCSGKSGKGLNSFSALWGDRQYQGADNSPWLLVITGISRISCTFIKRNFKKSCQIPNFTPAHLHSKWSPQETYRRHCWLRPVDSLSWGFHHQGRGISLQKAV